MKTHKESVSQQVRSFLQNGITSHRAGEFTTAEAIYLQILRISPDQPDALHLLGLTAHQAGKYEVAIELFDKAITVNPHYEVYSAIAEIR